jgi:hypothetical protein
VSREFGESTDRKVQLFVEGIHTKVNCQGDFLETLNSAAGESSDFERRDIHDSRSELGQIDGQSLSVSTVLKIDRPNWSIGRVRGRPKKARENAC